MLLPLVLLFVLEVVARTSEGLSSKLEGFDSFGVGSFDYPFGIKNNIHNMNQLIINYKFNKNYGTKLLKG
jgi:hypothetical protein